MHETFITLLTDRAHWEFEIFLMVLFDGLIIGALVPFVRKHWQHHIARDKRDQNNEVCDAMFGSELPPIWPRSGRFYEPVKGKPCPRCGIGIDDDGDGDCSHCAGKYVLGNCDHPWGNVLHENMMGDCINWKPVSIKTRKNHG